MTSSVKKPRTLGELKESGYQPLSIREEMRKNLIHLLESGGRMFPDVLGYEQTVIPRIENAILAGHDMIFLGERGQGKTRIIRSLVRLLDDEIPVIKGSEINDDPFAPVSRLGQEMLARMDDEMEIEWLPRARRYTEKLATPDTSVAELIGEIDPIKVAEGRYLSDEFTIHFGLIPRTNRGIFAINELPDLSEKVQVSLFNVLEERDLQIKGYKIQLPLDLLVVATANPEDYTSRGRIITPLKDRYSAHIHTHYPASRDVEIAIVDQEIGRFARPGREVCLPKFLKEIIAEITFQARQSPDINQVSGVSVRMSISNMESLIGNAEKRAIRNREREIAPRVSDLDALFASTEGKLELEYTGQNKSPEQIFQKLVQKALKTVFQQYFTVEELEGITAGFKDGWWLEVSDAMPAKQYTANRASLKAMDEAITKLGPPATEGAAAAAMEFILEGLHLSNKLNKEVVGGAAIYNEAHKIQSLGRNTDLA
jgi:magnesium chelatase subunit I